jgi:hypothetical protein
MLAAAEACRGAISYPYKQLRKENSFFSNIFAMVFNWVKSTRKNPQNPDELESSFQDYLDGYFNSFDYYPVCTRQIFARNDAYALWVDFMKVAGDLSNATGEMITSPERFLALGSISGEELKKRKQQAATKALERTIEQATVGSSSGRFDST